jgi:hypothetical protein
MKTGAYRSIVGTIEEDIADARAADPAVGVGFSHDHRLFDVTWLRSPGARFELTAVSNRMDRMHVAPNTCGEVRLIYRLAYTSSRSASRLPMTVNVVFPQTGDCAAIARSWLTSAEPPLGQLPAYAHVEINFQAVRWPSHAREDMGGHAEYVLRVFDPSGDSLVPRKLENTPRTDLSPEEKERLKAWIGDHRIEIDRGTALVPEEFLTYKAVAVGPRGLARLANRPFKQLFGDASVFEGWSFDGDKLVGSPESLLRRLDTMTCNGCHQTRSMAGFHLLGEERDPNQILNALNGGISAHLRDEMPWRRAQLEAVANGDASFDTPRPFAERGALGGIYGAHCGLEDWGCNAGLVCKDRNGDGVGACAARTDGPGDAYELASVSENADSHRDRVSEGADERCVDSTGRANSGDGFPNGMCYAKCSNIGAVNGDTICGGVPFGSGPKFGGIDNCLFKLHRPFQECLADDAHPTVVRACDASRPCRDDFICARVQNAPDGVGACMPPYFVFQARVDGHQLDDASPSPEPSNACHGFTNEGTCTGSVIEWCDHGQYKRVDCATKTDGRTRCGPDPNPALGNNCIR